MRRGVLDWLVEKLKWFEETDEQGGKVGVVFGSEVVPVTIEAVRASVSSQ